MMTHAPVQSPDVERNLRLYAGLLAVAALVIAAAALVGYLLNQPLLMQVHADWQGMSPVTAAGLVAGGVVRCLARRGAYRVSLWSPV